MRPVFRGPRRTRRRGRRTPARSVATRRNRRSFPHESARREERGSTEERSPFSVSSSPPLSQKTDRIARIVRVQLEPTTPAPLRCPRLHVNRAQGFHVLFSH